MSEEKNNSIPISKEVKNIHVEIGTSKREQELTDKIEKQAITIGSLMNQSKNEFVERTEGKPAPMGGETAPLTEPEYYQYKKVHVPNCEYDPSPNEPIPVDFSVEKPEDAFAFIKSLANKGNVPSQKVVDNVERKAMKNMHGKEAVLQGGLCKWRNENGRVVRATEKPFFKVVDNDE